MDRGLRRKASSDARKEGSLLSKPIFSQITSSIKHEWGHGAETEREGKGPTNNTVLLKLTLWQFQYTLEITMNEKYNKKSLHNPRPAAIISRSAMLDPSHAREPRVQCRQHTQCLRILALSTLSLSSTTSVIYPELAGAAQCPVPSLSCLPEFFLNHPRSPTIFDTFYDVQMDHFISIRQANYNFHF